MIDISSSMNDFKEATTHIWNTYLGHTADPFDPNLQISRDLIERELFRTIVLNPVGDPDYGDMYRQGPMNRVRIEFIESIDWVPIQVSTLDFNGNHTWEVPQKTNIDKFGELHFIDLFDWDPYGSVDMTKIKIFDLSNSRSILIDEMYCKVFYKSC